MKHKDTIKKMKINLHDYPIDARNNLGASLDKCLNTPHICGHYFLPVFQNLWNLFLIGIFVALSLFSILFCVNFFVIVPQTMYKEQFEKRETAEADKKAAETDRDRLKADLEACSPGAQEQELKQLREQLSKLLPRSLTEDQK